MFKFNQSSTLADQGSYSFQNIQIQPQLISERQQSQQIKQNAPPPQAFKQYNNQKNEKKKNFFDFYKSGKQKIMISFYNIYRNYPSNPPSFSNTPIWMFGKCYNGFSKPSITQSMITSGYSSCGNELMTTSQIQQQQSSSINNLFSSIFNSSNNNNNQQQSLTQSTIKCNNTITPQFLPPNTKEEANLEIERFLTDFKNILWFSYRKDFAPIENTNITTDIGWGCMVRTGQMLLARALLRHLYSNENIPEVDKARPHSKYRKVMSWFCDLPSKEHHYSIHQIVHKNKIIAKYHNSKLKDFDIDSEESLDLTNVDEWFAPTKISVVLKHLLKSHGISDIKMYVPSDGVVYRDHVRKLCLEEKPLSNNDPDNSGVISGCDSFIGNSNDNRYSARVPSLIQSYPYKSLENQSSHTSFTSFVPSKSPPSSMEDENYLVGENSSFKDPLTCSDFFSSSCIPQVWKSIIILIPIKLGVDKLNEVYFREIKSMLEIPQSIGFIGGKPKQSFYFVGYQDDSIIYLDPHFVHDTVYPGDSNFADTYHSCVPQKMPISQLDPSMAIGFYCKTQNDFEDFCQRIREIEKRGFPVVSIGEQCPDYQVESDDVDLDEFEEECENSFIQSQGQVSDFVGTSISSNAGGKFGDTDDDMDGFTMVN